VRPAREQVAHTKPPGWPLATSFGQFQGAAANLPAVQASSVDSGSDCGALRPTRSCHRCKWSACTLLKLWQVRNLCPMRRHDMSLSMCDMEIRLPRVVFSAGVGVVAGWDCM
jgi:hypothetical protein